MTMQPPTNIGAPADTCSPSLPAIHGATAPPVKRTKL
jgi:hypothetical protein